MNPKAPQAPVIVDFYATADQKVETRTKWQVWGGLGPDPYPDRDMDEPVVAISHAPTYRYTARQIRGPFLKCGSRFAFTLHGNIHLDCLVENITMKRDGTMLLEGPAYESDRLKPTHSHPFKCDPPPGAFVDPREF